MRVESRRAAGHAAIVVGLFALLFGWLWAYAPLHGGYLSESDLYEEFLPGFLAPLTLWSSFEFGGSPSFADPGDAAWYPLHLLFAHLFHSWSWYIAAANVVAAAGAYAYVFSLTRSKTAAAFSGVAYALSEAMMERVAHLPTMHTAAWLPFLLLCIDGLRGTRTLRWTALGALVVGISFLAGNPQTFLYSGYLCAAYGIAGGIAERARPRYYAAAAATVALGALLAAVLIAPVLETSLYTARQTVNFGQFISGALGPGQLFTYVFPRILHGGRGTPTYVGILTLIFACVSVRRLGRDWRVTFWCAAAGVAVLVALGDTTPVARAVFELPFYDRFRLGIRHLHIAALGLSILGGLGVADILARRATWRATAAGSMVVLLAASAAAWAMAGWPDRFQLEDWFELPWRTPIWESGAWIQMGSILVLVAVALAFARMPRSKALTALLVGLLAADLTATLSYRLRWSGLETTVLPRQAALTPSVHAARLAAGLAPQQQRYLAPSGTHLDALVPAAFARLWRIPIAGGYSPMLLERYARTALLGTNGSVETLDFASQNTALDVMAVRYLGVHEEDLVPADTFERDGLVWDEQRFDLPVGPPECVEQRSPQVTLSVPPGVTATEIALVAHLRCGEAIQQDAPVASIRVSGDGGEAGEFTLRAGVEIGDEILGDPALRERVAHRPAQVFETDADRDSYLVRLTLAAPVSAPRIDVTFTGGYGAMIVDRLTIVDENGESRPQALAALLLEDTERWRPLGRIATSRLSDREEDEDAPGEEGYQLFENRRAQPRARIVGETVALNDTDREMALHYSRLPDGRRFDPAAMAILEEGSVTARFPAGAGSASVQAIDNGRIVVEAATAGGGFLVLSENFYPGWEARVDGARTPIVRTDGTLQGVTLPPGSHTVTFELRSTTLRLGAGTSAGSLIFVLVLLWRTRARGNAAIPSGSSALPS